MNNYLFLILLVWACNRAPQEILVHNVGQAQGTTYSIKYLEQNETDYQWEIDSILKVIDESMSTYSCGCFKFYYFTSKQWFKCAFR